MHLRSRDRGLVPTIVKGLRGYDFHPHHLLLTESVRVDGALGDGDVLVWGPARIQALSTPGHTDGSLSYLVEVDGKKTVFCGDAIYDHGQLWDLYSLQKGTQRSGVPPTRDYHGFLGARQELVAGLRRIEEIAPTLLVPSHGRLMDRPQAAIDLLVRRLAACYDKYVAISALRYYFPAAFTKFAGRSGHTIFLALRPIPSALGGNPP
jgi:glyoxylase-like metal-dependent hydrolase (beta-lactamase superfamily II)